MENRLNYIDRAKGCAIFLVVMGHVYHITLRNYDGFFVEMIYSFHMFLFFFLSGLVSVKGVSSPYWSYRKLMSKIYGLIVPMLLFGFLYVFLENAHDFRIEYIWNQFLLNTLKHGYWYLFVLAIFYLSLVLYRINRKDKLLIHAFISIVLWGGYYLGKKLVDETHDLLSLINCSNYFAFFIMGVFASKYHLLDKLAKNNWMFSVTFIGYVLTWGSCQYLHQNSTLLHTIIIPTFAVTTIIYLFVFTKGKDNKWCKYMEYLGRNSLFVYLLHYYLACNIHLTRFTSIVKEIGPFGELMIVIIASITITVLCLCLSWIINQSEFIMLYVFRKKQ